jgi:predicted DNA-binding ribbon-helix-helix protein
MKSPVVKRSIVVGGHKTSVSLEEPFWTSMKEISRQLRVTLSELVSEIDTNRQQSNLSSAIRLFVLDHFKASPRARPPSPSRALITLKVWQSRLLNEGSETRQGDRKHLRVLLDHMAAIDDWTLS